MPMGGVSSGNVGISPASNLKPLLMPERGGGAGGRRHFVFLSSQHSFEMKSGEFAAYRLIFEPQEVAEVEIAIAQRHGGVTLLEVAPRRADLVPHLQFRPINLEMAINSNLYTE